MVPLRVSAVAIPSFILQRLHRVRGANCQRSLETERPATSVAYNAEGLEILVGHADGVARLWDVAHFTLSREFIPHDAAVLSVASCGSRWGTSCQTGRVRVWGGFGEPIREFRDEPGHPVSPCNSVAWNLDGTHLLTGHEDRSVRLYDPTAGKRLKRMAVPAPARAVAFGPEDVQVALLTGGTVMMWALERESPTATLQLGEPNPQLPDFNSFAFSRDRRMLATAVQSQEVHLSHWGELLCALKGHNDVVTCLAWSPEGRYLLTGSEDCTARVWDTTTRDCVATVNDVCTVRGVAWSPHGHDFVTVNEDGTLRVYELDSEWFDLDDAVEQALAVLEGVRMPLWPTKAPMDLDFVLDVWSDVRRRGRHLRMSNELAERGAALRNTVLELLGLLCGDASPEVPPGRLERYTHPLFRIALADPRLASDLCVRLGGGEYALATLQRMQRATTMELATSGWTIAPKR